MAASWALPAAGIGTIVGGLLLFRYVNTTVKAGDIVAFKASTVAGVAPPAGYGDELLFLVSTVTPQGLQGAIVGSIDANGNPVFLPAGGGAGIPLPIPIPRSAVTRIYRGTIGKSVRRAA